jgi:hypothetical protein
MFWRTPRWSTEERAWIDSERFPPVVVRSYRKERHLKRDAKRLRYLGYGITFQTYEWPGTCRWYVTYRLQRPELNDDRRKR